MMPVFVAAQEIQESLRRAGEKFCFIGAVALLAALREMPESLERLRQLRASVEKGS